MANMNPLGGLQILPDNVDAALSTLGAGVAIILNTNYGSALSRSFLAKQYSQQMGVTDLDPNDAVITGWCNGDMTVAQIKAALETDINDPDSFSNWEEIMNTRGILWQTLVYQLGVAGGQRETTVKIGGSKGIPFVSGEGIQLFAYNPGAVALTTGAVVGGLIQFKGIWLDDQ